MRPTGHADAAHDAAKLSAEHARVDGHADDDDRNQKADQNRPTSGRTRSTMMMIKPSATRTGARPRP
jgi:hypothetical protein